MSSTTKAKLCGTITKAGTPCKRKVSENSNSCWQHGNPYRHKYEMFFQVYIDTDNDDEDKKTLLKTRYLNNQVLAYWINHSEPALKDYHDFYCDYVFSDNGIKITISTKSKLTVQNKEMVLDLFKKVNIYNDYYSYTFDENLVKKQNKFSSLVDQELKLSFVHQNIKNI